MASHEITHLSNTHAEQVVFRDCIYIHIHINTYIQTHIYPYSNMHVATINVKVSINLKESKDSYMGGFKVRKEYGKLI